MCYTRCSRSAGTPHLILGGRTQIRNLHNNFRTAISAPRAIRVSVGLDTIATTTCGTCTLTTTDTKVKLAQRCGGIFPD
jgi:hypothetical protein